MKRRAMGYRLLMLVSMAPAMLLLDGAAAARSSSHRKPAAFQITSAGWSASGALTNSNWHKDYDMSFAKGDRLLVTLTHAPNREIGIYLYGPPPDRRFLNYSSAYGKTTERFIHEIPTAGTYRLRAFLEYSESQLGNTYNVAVETLPADNSGTDLLEFWPGEAVQQLTGDDTADGYSISTETTVPMRFSLTPDEGFNGSLTLRGPSGQSLQGSLVQGESYFLIDTTIPANETWTASVGDGVGAYRLWIGYPVMLTPLYSSARATVTYGNPVHFKGRTWAYGNNLHLLTPVNVRTPERTYYSEYSWTWRSAYPNMGYFDVVAFPPFNGNYQATWMADSDHDFVRGPLKRIYVKARIGLSLSARRTNPGQRVSIRTTVKPNHRNLPVYLERLAGGSWVRFSKGKLAASNGDFATASTFKWTRAFKRGTYVFRVRFAGDDSHVANASGRKVLVVD